MRNTALSRLKKTLFRRGYNKIIKGTFNAYIIRILSVGIGFAVHIVLARVLGPESYGRYVYPITWLNLITILSAFGLENAGKKFIPIYRSKKMWGEMHGFLEFSNYLIFIVSGSLFLIGSVLLYVFWHSIHIELAVAFVVTLFLIPLQTYLQVESAFLVALKKVVQGLWPSRLLKPLTLLVGGIGFYFFLSAKIFAYQAVLLHGLALAIALFISIFYLYKWIPEQAFREAPIFKSKKWIGVSFPLLLASGFHLLLGQADVILIGLFMNTTTSGFYSVGTKIATLVVFGLNAVNMVVAPLISEYYSNDNFKKLQNLVSFSSLISILIALPITIGLFVFSGFILNLFGDNFIKAEGALYILLLTQLFNTFWGSVSYLMTMTEYHVESLWILTFASLLNIILNVLMIPALGMIGAACATALSTVAWNVGMFIFVLRKIGVNSTMLPLIGHRLHE